MDIETAEKEKQRDRDRRKTTATTAVHYVQNVDNIETGMREILF